jgi:serine/threonine-protein kinase
MSMIQPELARIGRYQLVTLLAEGGMARVYLAFARGPAGFDKLVVVKQIRPELAWDQDFVTMFFDEARIAARLNHANVVHTYEVVEENGLYLLVMEYLEGHTVGEALRRITREAMPLDQHLWILTQVLAGLSYAHDLRDYDGTPLGVVHRDVSPSNVFLSYSGEVKLLDFGIAKAAGAISATHEGTIKGKLGYSAPEQFLQSEVDCRADLYAVGVMLWEALGRRRRRMADTPAATYQARISGLEPKIREVCPDVPRVLAEICDRATAPDPADRYDTAADFQRELEEYLDQVSRPPGQRELAALLDRHFQAERLEVRARVQELLSTAITQHPPGSTAVSFASRSPPGALYDLPITEASDAPPDFRGALHASALRHRPLLIAGGLVMIIGAFAAAFSRRDSPTPPVDAVAANPAPAPAASATPPAEEAKKIEATPVQLYIHVKPVSAMVTLDGARLVSNPFQADVTVDKRAHVLHASAPGYQSAEQVITFGNDVRVEITLKPLPGAAGKAARLAEAAQRAAIENWRPVGGEITRVPTEPSPSGRTREPEVELKRSPATPPRTIDEKDPYSP